MKALGFRFSAALPALLAAALIASLPCAVAQDSANWNKPSEPCRIVGPVHYVGTNELAAFLIATPDGHILVDGGMPESASLIEKSIRTLGFDPKDIRHLLITQGHYDHVGSLGQLKRLSGGQVAVMDADVALIESGGATDYLFADAGPRMRFDKVKVDRTLHDGDSVSIGGVTLTARRTPGHTPGSTTWLATVEDGGKRYEVVFAASTSINPGTRLLDRPSYPGIADDFAHTFEVLESLKPDVFLGGHTGFFGLEEKRAKLASGRDPNPFVDPDGYRVYVATRKRAFEEQRERERAALARPARKP